MKRVASILLTVVLAVAMSLSFTACGGIEVDSTKTQLYIQNYDGGFGDAWLVEKANEFETLYKDWKGEGDKVGVQIVVTNQIDGGGAVYSKIRNNKIDIYFTEVVNYYQFVTGEGGNPLLDLTDIVTEPLTKFGENKTIESKLTTEQKEYYSSATTGNKYYALPHYSSYFGITYDVDLFDKEGFYFAATPTGTGMGRFVSASNTVKTKGPDGIADTSDDGLPTTYEEFFELCDYMVTCGTLPLSWAGETKEGYISAVLYALFANYAGAEDFSDFFDAKGTFDLIKSFDGNTPNVTKDVTVKRSEGNQVFQQAGIYYSLEFLEKMLTKKYYNKNSSNHLKAQSDFLYSDSKGKPIAMHIDGTYWENEATKIFRDMANNVDEKWSKDNRKLAFMPLPKHADKVGTDNILVDYLHSAVFVDGKLKGTNKESLAKDFVAFVNTDDSLSDFSKSTSAYKGLNYEMSDTDLEQLTHFSKSIYNLKQNSTVVYPVSENPVFYNNFSSFLSSGVYYREINDPVDQIQNGKDTAKSYFQKIGNYYNANKWSSMYKSHYGD